MTQQSSRILNPLLKMFLWFNDRKLDDNYLVYDRIVSPNVLCLTLVLYEHRFSRVKFRHRRYFLIILIVAIDYIRRKRHLLVQDVCTILRQNLIWREIHAIFIKIISFRLSGCRHAYFCHPFSNQIIFWNTSESPLFA